MIEGVDHVAIVVRDVDAALGYYLGPLGLPMVGREDQPETGVRVAYVQAAGVKLQLVQALRPGPIQDFLAAHGEGLHHVCFAVRDIPEALRHFAPGTEVPIRMGGGGRRVCFLPPQPTGLVVELIERDPYPGAVAGVGA